MWEPQRPANQNRAKHDPTACTHTKLVILSEAKDPLPCHPTACTHTKLVILSEAKDPLLCHPHLWKTLGK